MLKTEASQYKEDRIIRESVYNKRVNNNNATKSQNKDKKKLRLKARSKSAMSRGENRQPTSQSRSRSRHSRSITPKNMTNKENNISQVNGMNNGKIKQSILRKNQVLQDIKVLLSGMNKDK